MISPDHKIILCENAKTLAYEGALFFMELVNKYIEEKESVNVVLSGGSTPKVLYYLLSGDDLKNKVDWSKVHLFWGDERAVPPDNDESNYRMVREMLIKGIEIPEENVHRIKGEEGEGAADLYRIELTENISDQKEGIPVFDIIILGMGTDGHTASLFPESSLLHEKEVSVASLYVEKLDSTRITITPPVIKAARNILVLISGKNKAAAMKEVWEKELSNEKHPIQLVNDCAGKVTWLIDKDAASLLENGSFS